MKAVVFTGRGKLELQEVEHPVPGPDEVIVEVKACGICGTDQHIYHGMPGSAEVHPPMVLGHELAGIVTATGSAVRSLKRGDRVSIDPNIYCRACDCCRKGRYHLCRRLQAVGVTRSGGMSQFCAVPAANAYRLPDSLSYEEGAMIEPLGCVIHGIGKLVIEPGASMIIIGGGYIGQMMLQMGKLYGAAPVIVCEPDVQKRQIAESLGAAHAIDPYAPDAAEVLAMIVPEGADIVVECVGRPETMAQAVKWAGKGGQVLLFGVAAPEAAFQVSPFDIFSKELTIRGSFINPHTHDKAIALTAEGKIQIEPLISHRFSLDDMPVVMKEYRERNVMKGIITNF